MVTILAQLTFSRSVKALREFQADSAFGDEESVDSQRTSTSNTSYQNIQWSQPPQVVTEMILNLEHVNLSVSPAHPSLSTKENVLVPGQIGLVR